MIDQARWDVWLHKIYDMDFGDYLARLNDGPATEEIPKDEVLEATVRDSMGIINGFCPS